MNFIVHDSQGIVIGRFFLSDISEIYSLYGPNVIPINQIQYNQPLEISHRVESSALIEKAAISFIASKTSILSNGTDVTTITVNGLIGAVRIDMGPISTIVTTDNPYMILSSNVRQNFPLSVVPDRYHYGAGMLTIVCS